MKKKNRTALIVVVALLAVIGIVIVGNLYMQKSPFYSANKLLSVRLYDINGNPINTGFQQTMVNGIAKVGSADFTVNLENTGNRALICYFKSLNPSSFSTAFNIYSESNPSKTTISLSPGQKTSVTSDRVDLTVFEPSTSGVVVPVDFSLIVHCTYPEGTLERTASLRLNMERDDYPEPGLNVNINNSVAQTAALLKCGTGTVPSGQVLYMPFNNDQTFGESSSLVHDFSGNSFDGLVYGSPTYASTGGRFGDGAFVFDGIDDHIEVADEPQFSPANYGNQITVTMWIRPDTYTFKGESQGYNHFMGKGGQGGDYEWMWRLYNSTAFDGVSRSKRFSFYAFNLAGGLGTGSYFQPNVNAGINGPAPDYAPGEWIFVAGEINGTHTRIYQNGILRDGNNDPLSGYSIVPADGTAPVRIGTSDHDSFFIGSIDEVRIFNRALTDAEVMQLYNLNKCTYNG